MRRLAIVGLLLAAFVAVSAQTTVPFTSFCYIVTGGTVCQTEPNRWSEYGVNIKEFGALGDGSTDDTAAIQAAIDYAVNNGKQSIFCPNGNYVTTRSLFLDPPGNLRGSAAAWSAGTTYAINNVVTSAGVPWISLTNGNIGNTPSVTSTFWEQTSAAPTLFHFSLAFTGPREGTANYESVGCNIKPTFNNAVAFWVGTGNGMSVTNIQIIGGGVGAYRGNQNPNGIGICVAGGGGGANRGLIDNVLLFNFYTAFMTGCNQDSLAAEFTLRKVVFANCFVGINFSKTQNDINSVVDVSSGGCTTGVSGSGAGRPINVQGGNLSTSGVAAKFTFGSMTSLTTTTCPGTNFKCYSFTGVITSPDVYVGSVYNSYMLKTAHFGVVPFTMTSWNSGTNTGTFAIWPNWGAFYFNQSTDAQAVTDLQNEMQAVTTLYATERVTLFDGPAFHNFGGTWVENPSACTTFVNSTSGFNGDANSLFERNFFNYDPSMNAVAGAGDATLAYFYCQQSFPFINMGSGSGSITFKTTDFHQGTTSDPVVIDITPTSAIRLFFEGINTTVTNPSCRATGWTGSGYPITASYLSQYSGGFGCGEWDQTPFNVSNALANGGPGFTQYPYWQNGNGRTPWTGWRPAISGHPRIDSATFTTLQSISGVTLGTYPLVDGSVIYSLGDWNSGTLTHIFARSAHKFASYGQNLTTTNVGAGLSWNTKGQSFVVNMDAASLSWMQPGLGILLNTSANTHYVVTGVYPSLGYITVLNGEQDGSPFLTAGVKTTIYTGTLISQDAYSWTQYP